MSIKIMAEVWELALSQPEQLVLLAMADHADHDGKNVRPSVARIAWKTGYSERQVQRLIGRLVAGGLLVPQADSRRGGRGRTTEYHIATQNGVRKAPGAFGRGTGGAAMGDGGPAERVTGAAAKGDGGLSPDSSKKPSGLEPAREPSQQPAAAGEEEGLVRTLRECGLTRRDAEVLAAECREEEIRRQIGWLPYRNCRSPRYWLPRYVREGWPRPAGLAAEEPAEEKARRVRETAERAGRQAERAERRAQRWEALGAAEREALEGAAREALSASAFWREYTAEKGTGTRSYRLALQSQIDALLDRGSGERR